EHAQEVAIGRDADRRYDVPLDYVTERRDAPHRRLHRHAYTTGIATHPEVTVGLQRTSFLVWRSLVAGRTQRPLAAIRCAFVQDRVLEPHKPAHLRTMGCPDPRRKISPAFSFRRSSAALFRACRGGSPAPSLLPSAPGP